MGTEPNKAEPLPNGALCLLTIHHWRHTAYPAFMLRTMRTTDGGPSMRVRMVALLVALGMLLTAAPVLIHVVRWTYNYLL